MGEGRGGVRLLGTIPYLDNFFFLNSSLRDALFYIFVQKGGGTDNSAFPKLVEWIN